jgi:Gpi18-like mannosyltransferase
MMLQKQFWNKDYLNRLKCHWFWRAVLFPFVLTRLALMLAIYYSEIFPKLNGPIHPTWNFTVRRFVSAWSNWDSFWYITIIKSGYSLLGPIGKVQSNIAFYPLYPTIVKIISWPLYSFFPNDIVLIGVGTVVSNLFFLGALFLLYKLIHLVFENADLAERSILYLLLFPAALYFSCIYTESTFLFLAIASF